MLSAESINYIDNQVFLSVDIEQDAYLYVLETNAFTCRSLKFFFVITFESFHSVTYLSLNKLRFLLFSLNLKIKLDTKTNSCSKINYFMTRLID